MLFGSSSHDRFVRATWLASQYNSGNILLPAWDYAWDILESVQNRLTQWQLVYDVKNKIVYFRTLDNKIITTLSLDEFDFDCKQPVLMMDINGKISGNKNREFIPYNKYYNKKSIQMTFRRAFLPAVILPSIMANYPDKHICE